MQDPKAHLQSVWDENFPMAKAMGLQVEHFDDEILRSRAPLALNTNIHDSGFAGSLYSAMAMTCWGLLYLKIQQRGLDASIIHGHADVNFDAIVRSDIVAEASFASLEHHLDELADKGKTRMTMHAEVVAADQAAARLKGLYLARLN